MVYCGLCCCKWGSACPCQAVLSAHHPWWHRGRGVTGGPSLLHLEPSAPPLHPRPYWLGSSSSSPLLFVPSPTAACLEPAALACPVLHLLPVPHKSLVTVPVMSPLPCPLPPLPSRPLMSLGQPEHTQPPLPVHLTNARPTHLMPMCIMCQKEQKNFSFQNSTE